MNAPERETRFLTAAADTEQQMSTREFIGFVAAMMALTALAIDIMLPALPAIGDALGITNPNDRQVIIITYMLGFSIGQLGYGRLSDSYGRKPVLMAGLAVFIAGSLMASLSSDFTWLLVARTLQGIGAAAPRVIAVAIVRDRYAGRQMARVMSFALAVFIIIPVLAPAMGQGLLHVGTWRHVFDLLLVAGVIVALWAGLRLPETKRGCVGEPLSLGASIKYAVETPQTIGYAISGGLLFGCVLGYVSSAQQIFVDIYRLGFGFPLAFGGIALTMAAASLTNAQLVERLGMRRLSHTALAGFIALSGMLVLASAFGYASLTFFVVMMMVLFFLFGLVASNFNALAMEPQGDNAGMASSVIGFVNTGLGALAAGIVGHMFDGTVVPLALGFLGLSVAAFAVVVWVEGARGVFRPGS
jgi:DHA1 family bicyclomycin/chloramphenicol resistance-like MFS transporter